MTNSTFGWIVLAFAVTVLLGALRVPRWLVGIVSLLALPGTLIFIVVSPGSLDANGRAAILIWGTLFVIFVAPMAGAAGFLGAWLGSAMTGKKRLVQEGSTVGNGSQPIARKITQASTNAKTAFISKRWLARLAALGLFVALYATWYYKKVDLEQSHMLEGKSTAFVTQDKAVGKLVCGAQGAFIIPGTFDEILLPTQVTVSVSGGAKNADVVLSVVGTKKQPIFSIQSMQETAWNLYVENPILREVRCNGAAGLAKLLDSGELDIGKVSLEDSGVTILNTLVNRNQDEAVALLIDRGVDPNMVSSVDMNMPEWMRTPAIRQAVSRGSASTVRLLLERGANPNALLASQWFILDQSVKDKNDKDAKEKIQLLYEHGANYIDGQMMANEQLSCLIDDVDNVDVKCLPKLMRFEDSELERKFSQMLARVNDRAADQWRSTQAAWVRDRDSTCGIQFRWSSHGGWISYVLNAPQKARCVLHLDHERAKEISDVPYSK